MTIHKSVLLKETIDALKLRKGMIVIDATLGGGGHTLEILKKIGKTGKIIAFDADISAIEKFKKKAEWKKIKNIILVNANFRNLTEELTKLGIEKVDAILADIGYSSDQLENKDRGISFQLESPLDMRFDQFQELTAKKIINEYDCKKLEKILREFGEEKYAGSIARGILKKRKEGIIESTKELVEIIKENVLAKYCREKIHPATKTFQAIRIEVNQELDSLRKFIPSALDALKFKGRLAIISFHSLEDRIVKEIFRINARGCICPRDFPICLCKQEPKIRLITKKPLVSKEDELRDNPRARSAKLRVCERI